MECSRFNFSASSLWLFSYMHIYIVIYIYMIEWCSKIEPRRKMRMEVHYALFLLILSLLSIITFPGVTSAPSPDLISQVCAKTKNPRLCLKYLYADMRTHWATSLRQLGEVSLNLSMSSAQATKQSITKLRLVTIDKTQKARLKSCLTNYESALYYLGTASHYWKIDKFEDVVPPAAAAVNEPVSCRGYFEEGPPPVPSIVRDGSSKLETLCRVVLVVSNQLSGAGSSKY